MRRQLSPPLFRRIVLMLGLIVIVGLPYAGFSDAQEQRIDLEFANTSIQTVLTALSKAVGFNLVLGPEVTGDIDVRLHDVDWKTALHTILSAHGFRYFWKDDVLVVMSEDGGSMEGLEHHVLKLHYAEPTTVQAALASVLSPRGKIELVGPTSAERAKDGPVQQPMLVITELPHRIGTVLALVDSLDTPPPQFEIGVKFVETDAESDLGIGFGWPTRVSATLSDRDENGSSSTETGEQTPASAKYPIPDEKIWNFGTLSVGELNGFLEFMKQTGSGRLLSDPRVSVLENELATMEVVTTIPIETLTRFTEGAVVQDIVDFQELDVGITLSVRPRLNDKGEITLEVEPEVEEITGFTGPIDNQRPITAKRGVKTTVRVKDGETLVIGGLVRETEFDTKSKVFLLGDIPLLGALFTHRSTQKEKTDLLIFITPRIIPSPN